MFKNHYETLGLNSSATSEEIRRAYRILARRYHPDLNPGKPSEERFKAIAEAYAVLIDGEERRRYDSEFAQAVQTGRVASARTAQAKASAAYARQGAPRSARDRFYEAKFQNFARVEPVGEEPTGPRPTARPKPHLSPGPKVKGAIEQLSDAWKNLRALAHSYRTIERPNQTQRPRDLGTAKVSIIEISLSLRDAVLGVRKTVEVAEPEGARKISVTIPPGVRTGSVLRLKAKQSPREELVLIVRVATHSFLSIHARGLVAEIPISVNEAIAGANIKIPTFEDAVMVKVPAGTQSGSELRLKGMGIAAKDGTRGDLFIRFLIKVPESSEAVGLKDKAGDLDRYYEHPVRQNLPAHLIEE